MTKSIPDVELWAKIRLVITKEDCPKDKVFAGTQRTTMAPVSTKELQELSRGVLNLAYNLNEDIATVHGLGLQVDDDWESALEMLLDPTKWPAMAMQWSMPMIAHQRAERERENAPSMATGNLLIPCSKN
jgi:hypothetical protein